MSSKKETSIFKAASFEKQTQKTHNKKTFDSKSNSCYDKHRKKHQHHTNTYNIKELLYPALERSTGWWVNCNLTARNLPLNTSKTKVPRRTINMSSAVVKSTLK